jgi:hypothetical protein
MTNATSTAQYCIVKSSMLLKQLLRHGVWKVRGRATGLHPKPGPEKPLMARLPPACRAVLAEP